MATKRTCCGGKCKVKAVKKVAKVGLLAQLSALLAKAVAAVKRALALD